MRIRNHYSYQYFSARIFQNNLIYFYQSHKMNVRGSFMWDTLRTGLLQISATILILNNRGKDGIIYKPKKYFRNKSFQVSDDDDRNLVSKAVVDVVRQLVSFPILFQREKINTKHIVHIILRFGVNDLFWGCVGPMKTLC